MFCSSNARWQQFTHAHMKPMESMSFSTLHGLQFWFAQKHFLKTELAKWILKITFRKTCNV